MPLPDWLPGRRDWRELARPWKLACLAIAMSWLLYGALYYGIGDWDVGITLIMGGLTYALAPWCARTLAQAVRQRPRDWPLRLLAVAVVAWWVVDGVYMLYHTVVGNPIYRADNFHASLPIFFMAGAVWCYYGSAREFLAEVRTALGR